MLHSWAASTGMSPHRPLLLAALAKKKKKSAIGSVGSCCPHLQAHPGACFPALGPALLLFAAHLLQTVGSMSGTTFPEGSKGEQPW